MKKIIIASILISTFGFAQAQNYNHHYNHENYGRNYDESYKRKHNNYYSHREEKENWQELMRLEREVKEQRYKIDRVIYRRLISPEEANQITFNYNKILTMLDKAKFNKRITDREIQRIEYALRRNKRELEMMMKNR